MMNEPVPLVIAALIAFVAGTVRGFAGFGAAMLMTPVLAALFGPTAGVTLCLLLEFAVHDLGARGVGALLVYRPDDDLAPAVELRLPEPPPLRITRAADLAPLGHVLKQVDGAAVLDASGTLRQLGVRLVPSPEAESDVEGYRGMRHTSARRYSFDDPLATVIVVSEDGPVTVLRNGEILGQTDSNVADPTQRSA